jgi:hypothetical protein
LAALEFDWWPRSALSDRNFLSLFAASGFLGTTIRLSARSGERNDLTVILDDGLPHALIDINPRSISPSQVVDRGRSRKVGLHGQAIVAWRLRLKRKWLLIPGNIREGLDMRTSDWLTPMRIVARLWG